ncbi:MAG: DEAD/DEAH box helicase, partial [Limisphaerales bacterium]
AAAGLLISRAARGSVAPFVQRALGESVPELDKKELIDMAISAFETLELPPSVIAMNWTVNPFGQARLLGRFREYIAAGREDELIPVHPLPVSGAVRTRYVGIFSRINKHIVGKNHSKFSNKLASVGLDWMRGYPLPLIIKNTVKHAENTATRKVNYDAQIRGVFEFVEDILRFKYVQLGRAYVDLLRYALSEAKLDHKARAVYDFPLALELGVSSVAGQAFIELGLSRITASALESLIPDSDPTVESARKWLSGLTGVEFSLSKIIWDELARKQLIAA